MTQRPPADRATPPTHDPLDAPAPASRRRLVVQLDPAFASLLRAVPANDVEETQRTVRNTLTLSPSEERLATELVDAFMAKVLATSSKG